MRVLLLALAIATAIPGCSRSPDLPGDVVLIVIDTLRPDHLGIYGYARDTSPELDRWFAGAAVYERAYASSAYTPPSVVSVLSGLYPPAHRVRSYIQLVPEETTVIPQLLPESYQTAAFVSSAVLTNEAMGLASRFDHYDDFVDDPEAPKVGLYERDAEGTTDAALRWLRTQRDPDRPLFLFLHYIDPHWPYTPPETWTRSFDHPEPVRVAPGKLPKVYRERGIDDGLVVVDDYDEEIAYLDAELGRLLAGYDEHATIDDALVLLTADHGETMMEGPRWFAHSYYPFEAIVRVPFLIRGPGVASGRPNALVSGIDVLPTVLGFVGAEVPEGIAGVDLRRETPIPDRTIYAEAIGFAGRHAKAAIRPDKKWVAIVTADKAGEITIRDRRFYDLREDPTEKNAQAWPGDSPESDRLIEICETDPDPAGRPSELQRGKRLRGPKIAPRATDAQIEQLRALGYVE